MSTQVAGVLKDPFERPLANTDIDIRAITNTFAVLPGATVKVTTNALGEYNFILEPANYAISVILDGRAVYQGAISITSTTAPGTLPELLKQAVMLSELPLNYGEYFQQVQATVKSDADRAQAAADSIDDQVDEARQYAEQSQASAQSSQQSSQSSQQALAATTVIANKFQNLDAAVTQTQQNAQQTQSDATKTAQDRAQADAAAQRAEDAAASAETVNERNLRVPTNETINPFPAASARQNTVVVFDSAGQSALSPSASFSMLDSNGKVPLSAIPAAAITEVFPVASRQAMLALAADPGDVAIINNPDNASQNGSFILMASPASTLSNWKAITSDVLVQLGMSNGSQLVGYQSPRTGSVPTTVGSALDRFVSVFTFGAKGDNSTDDTAAFQAAHDSLPVGGGVIYVPGGFFYRIEGVVKLSKPVTFMGDGASSTTLTRSTSKSSVFIEVSSELVLIEKIRILGVGSEQSLAGYAIMTTPQAVRLTIKDVQILNVYSGCLLLSNLFHISNTEIRQIKVNSGEGFRIDQSAVTDGVGLITGSIVQNADDYEPYAGINFVHAVGILVSDSQLMQCGYSAVFAPPAGKGVSSVKFVNVYFDTSNNGGVLFSNASAGFIQRITIADSWMASCKNGAGLRAIQGSDIAGLRVSACEFYDSQNGILIDPNVTLQNFDVDFCVFSGNKAADMSFGSNASNFTVTNCRTGTSGGFVGSPTGLYINPGCNNFSISDCVLHNFTDASYPSSGVSIRNIKGWGYSSVVYDPPAISSGSGVTNTVGVAGARLGDFVEVSFAGTLNGVQLTGWVSQNDVVSFRFDNLTGSTQDLGAATVRAKISRLS